MKTHNETSSLARRLLTAFSAVLIVPAAISCGGTGMEGDDTAVAGTEEPLLVATGTKLWNDGSPLGTAAAVHVCFAVRPRLTTSNTTTCTKQTARDLDCLGRTITGVDALRANIRKQIENSWQRTANLELYGWDDCPIDAATNKHKESSLTRQVMIQFSQVNEPPANYSCTTDAQCQAVTTDGVDSGVRCRAASPRICEAGPVDWSGVGMNTSAPTVIQYNWKAINAGTDDFNLVHEFGHALGFSHEWLRQDWTQNRCNETAVAGNTLGTDKDDTNSIMQYCVSHSATGSKFSPWDVFGVQKAYGRKYKGSLVGYRGMCADIQGASEANGTPIIAFPCRGQKNDTFFRDPASSADVFATAGKTHCLNVSGGTAPNPVISWVCNTDANEDFKTQSVEWRAMGNMCVTAVSGRLQAKPCDGTSAQKWDFFHAEGSRRYDQIKNANGQCVQAQTTAGAMGEELILASCSSSETRQRFTFPGAGLVSLSTNTSRCLNVSGGKPVSGSKVVLWDGCVTTNPFQNAQFTLSGKIKALSNCMTIQGDNGVGAPIGVQSCSSSNTTTQVWEYYF